MSWYNKEDLNIDKRNTFPNTQSFRDFQIKIVGDFLEHFFPFVLENVNLKLFFLMHKQETKIFILFILCSKLEQHDNTNQ
jgi:hypothetical protein